MKRFSTTVNKIEDGILHVRSAGVIMKEASQYVSEVKIKKDDKVVDCKDILGLMGLRVSVGDTLSVSVAGPDEEVAAEGLKVFLNQHFI